MKKVLYKPTFYLFIMLALSACHQDEKNQIAGKENAQEGTAEKQHKCPENSGWSGENCDQCSGNFWGENCDKAPTCKNGTASLGINGTGKCSSCLSDTGWTGDNCDECSGNFWGEKCDKAPTCKNGTPSLGINGTGKCSSCLPDTGWTGDNCDECSGNFWGEKCDKAPTCNNGTPSLGIEGTGKCASCLEGTGWGGENCDECQDGWTDETCDVCAPGLTGPHCNTCQNGGYGPNCLLYGEVTDQDNNHYLTITIDDMEWMAQNYRRSSVASYLPTDGFTDERYGRLYDWNTATAPGFCPDGWHLAQKAEFDALLKYVDNNSSASRFLALINQEGWKNGNTDIVGKNTFGFGLLPAGCDRDYTDSCPGQAMLWTDTKGNGTLINPETGKPFETIYYLSANNNNVDLYQIIDSELVYFSARCVKNYTCKHGTASGADGCRCNFGWTGPSCNTCSAYTSGASCNEYKTTTINGKKWLIANIDSQVDKNGQAVTCYANTAGDSEFVKKYGCLYNWVDAMKVCPAGWHLPTQTEFNELLAYVQETLNTTSQNDIFLALIAKSSAWINASNEGTDSFLFSALPAGFGILAQNMGPDPIYSRLGTAARFWSSSEWTNDQGEKLSAYVLRVDKQLEITQFGKINTFCSVRCVQDDD